MISTRGGKSYVQAIKRRAALLLSPGPDTDPDVRARQLLSPVPGKMRPFHQGRGLYAVVLSRQWPSCRFTGDPVQNPHPAAAVRPVRPETGRCLPVRPPVQNTSLV